MLEGARGSAEGVAMAVDPKHEADQSGSDQLNQGNGMEFGRGNEAPESACSDKQEIDSSDGEIDYSTKPEFYDSDLDEKDEMWVRKKRKGRTSDALLSCPACFTTLCLDCQRHEKYVTQYRAMFVLNCEVKSNQVLKQGTQKPKRSKHRKPREEHPESRKDQGIFRPVCCTVCSTEVGVFDEDEVYHFFNVLPSYT